MTRHASTNCWFSAGFIPPARAPAMPSLRGTVTVDGVVAAKPAQNTGLECRIEILDEARAYVSRAALKLKQRTQFLQYLRQGLELPRHRRLDRRLHPGAAGAGRRPCHRHRRGPRPVDASLQANPHVTSIEGLNARDLTADHLAQDRSHRLRRQFHLAETRPAAALALVEAGPICWPSSNRNSKPAAMPSAAAASSAIRRSMNASARKFPSS